MLVGVMLKVVLLEENLKLPMVNNWIKKRRKLAEIYYQELKFTSLKLPYENKVDNCKHVFHLYVVYHPKRDLIIKKLSKQKTSNRVVV